MKKHKKFGDSDFLPTFALANENHAEIAQLVERNLAKVEVAGPSPVFRSNNKGRTESVLPLLLMQGMPGACLRDLKAPLSGAGGVNNGSRPSLAHSASVSPVFRSRKKGRILRLFPFCFVCMVQGLVPFPGFGCRFRQGVADCIADRPATYRKKCSVL